MQSLRQERILRLEELLWSAHLQFALTVRGFAHQIARAINGAGFGIFHRHAQELLHIEEARESSQPYEVELIDAHDIPTAVRILAESRFALIVERAFGGPEQVVAGAEMTRRG